MARTSCLSYAKRSIADRAGTGTGAGGGSGFEAVPDGVGLFPHEHCNKSQKQGNGFRGKLVVKTNYEQTLVV